MKIIKIRKKPVEVEAFELTKEMLTSCVPYSTIYKTNNRKVIENGREFKVETLEGDMIAQVGDWIIIGVKGEIYPCRKDIFEETYDK